jgi:hypothetical protein
VDGGVLAFHVSLARLFAVFDALPVLLLFSRVPVLHGSEVTYDSRIDLCVFATGWAREVFAYHVSVVRADREGRCYREVGDREGLRDGSDQAHACGWVADPLAEESVEDGAAIVEALEAFLMC